ncbi:MAG: hypothetical protein WC244_04775 [Patescibacteria group bacterium]|jgi:hypothetical protein
MKNIRSKLIFVVAVIALFFCSILGSKMVSAVMTSTDGYQIWADVISVGGAEDALSVSGDFQLRDTFGEPIVGRSSSTVDQIRAGFREMERGSLTLSITPSSIDLGNLSRIDTATATTTLSFYSDAPGSSVTFSGESLKNGSDYIQAAGASAVSSAIGTSQFGFNAIFSQGDNSAYSLPPYNQIAKYAFTDSEIVRTDSLMSDNADFTLNYIANISGSEPVGDYSTSLTFTALGGF